MLANFVQILVNRQAGCGRPALLWDGAIHSRFDEIPQRVGRMRAALETLGVRAGDRVMVKAGNSPWYAEVYLATLALGAIFVPINTAYTAEETAYLIEDADPALLIHESDTALPHLDGKAAITMESDGGGALPKLASQLDPNRDIAPVEPSDLAAILYTSGTTGRPKGAMLTHGNLRANVEALHEAWHFSDADIILHALPLFHAHGLFVALHLGLFSCATIHLLPRFSAEEVLSLLPNVTVFMGVPTFYSRLVEHPGFGSASCTHLRLFVSGSAPLLPALFTAFAERTGHRILERYGMTEALMIASNPYRAEGRIAGTVGFPLPGVRVRIVNSEGQEIEADRVGEIEICSTSLSPGYWNRPEASAESYRSDGYFKTGDVGCLDEAGRLKILGRSKDLIISGGYNIYPAEIEIALGSVAGVSEISVFGVPHADFGEAVAAALVVDPGSFSMASFHSRAEQALAKFKRPKMTYLVKELPRNAMGKVLKNELRSMFSSLGQEAERSI